MAKRKTPEELIREKSRIDLKDFHTDAPEKLARDAYDKPLKRMKKDARPTINVGAWNRVHPLVAGLENTIPKDRFAAINEALLSIDRLTIMVQNLRETSRADVTAYLKKLPKPGRPTGGRGHKADGSSNQATDADIDEALTQCGAHGVRKLKKTIIADAMIHLKSAGKQAGETTVGNRLKQMRSRNNRR